MWRLRAHPLTLVCGTLAAWPLLASVRNIGRASVVAERLGLVVPERRVGVPAMVHLRRVLLLDLSVLLEHVLRIRVLPSRALRNHWISWNDRVSLKNVLLPRFSLFEEDFLLLLPESFCCLSNLPLFLLLGLSALDVVSPGAGSPSRWKLFVVHLLLRKWGRQLWLKVLVNLLWNHESRWARRPQRLPSCPETLFQVRRRVGEDLWVVSSLRNSPRASSLVLAWRGVIRVPCCVDLGSVDGVWVDVDAHIV